MTLHRITGRATKCGPCAVSAITGIPTHTVAAVIRLATGRKAVNGTSAFELDMAMAEFGWDIAEAGHTAKAPQWAKAWQGFGLTPEIITPRTLASFLDTAPDGHWIIACANHWIAYAGGTVADSGFWFDRKPQPWTRQSPNRRSRVKALMRFEHTREIS